MAPFAFPLPQLYCRPGLLRALSLLLTFAEHMNYHSEQALEAIHSHINNTLNLHRFDRSSRTKTRLFGIGGPQGKQFALIIGDLDPLTRRPTSAKTVVVLPNRPVPSISGVLPTSKAYRTSRLRQVDSKLCPPDNLGFVITDETALVNLLHWYAGS